MKDKFKYRYLILQLAGEGTLYVRRKDTFFVHRFSSVCMMYIAISDVCLACSYILCGYREWTDAFTYHTATDESECVPMCNSDITCVGYTWWPTSVGGGYCNLFDNFNYETSSAANFKICGKYDMCNDGSFYFCFVILLKMGE